MCMHLLKIDSAQEHAYVLCSPSQLGARIVHAHGTVCHIHNNKHAAMRGDRSTCSHVTCHCQGWQLIRMVQYVL